MQEAGAQVGGAGRECSFAGVQGWGVGTGPLCRGWVLLWSTIAIASVWHPSAEPFWRATKGRWESSAVACEPGPQGRHPGKCRWVVHQDVQAATLTTATLTTAPHHPPPRSLPCQPWPIPTSSSCSSSVTWGVASSVFNVRCKKQSSQAARRGSGARGAGMQRCMLAARLHPTHIGGPHRQGAAIG